MDLWLLRLVTTKQGRKKWKNCRLSTEIQDYYFDRTTFAESRLLDTLERNFNFTQLNSRVSNIESDYSQNIGLEDYNNISDGIFPHFTTPSIKISLG